jgi:rhodanese-related sulfurtransferase
MTVRRVPPAEADRMLREEGYVYVDVRSIPEYDQGHVPGAFNVPLLHAGPAGMTPNGAFMSVVQANFPKDAKIITGCKAGGRSLRAAETMSAAGYTNVVDMQGGFHGEQDAMRRLVAKGWAQSELPVEAQPAPGHGYADLEAKAPK